MIAWNELSHFCKLKGINVSCCSLPILAVVRYIKPWDVLIRLTGIADIAHMALKSLNTGDMPQTIQDMFREIDAVIQFNKKQVSVMSRTCYSPG